MQNEEKDAGSCSSPVLATSLTGTSPADSPHSPLPWMQRNAFPAVIVDRQYGKVADCGMQEGVSEPDAAFIVRAVNSHDDLLDALRSFCGDYEATPTTDDISLKAAYLHALEVIAKAEGKP